MTDEFTEISPVSRSLGVSRHRLVTLLRNAGVPMYPPFGTANQSSVDRHREVAGGLPHELAGQAGSPP